MSGMPLITPMLLILPLGAALIWLMPRDEQARQVAAGAGVIALILAVAVLFAFDPATTGFQLIEEADWMPGLGIRYLVGVDGISVLFPPVTLLLLLGAIAISYRNVRRMPRAYYSLLLLEGAATLGVFCALDTIFFFLFWEMSIVPFYFLVSLWGQGANRRPAAKKYMLIMIAGGLPILFAFLLLGQYVSAAGAAAAPFDLRVLLDTPIPEPLQITVFLLLLVGFGVKAPLLPLHTWFPLLAAEGPIAVTALLAGLKLGAYGLIRFTVPLVPLAADHMQWLLLVLGTIGVVYGAVVALAQTNLRTALAYLGVSHVGLVVLGIASFQTQGLQGAVLELVNFPLIAGGLFLLTAALRQRTGSTALHSLGGAAQSMPWLASFYLLLGLASLGLPGTAGFPAELLILLAALETHTGTGIAALFGLVIGAACFLGIYRRSFFGPLTSPALIEAEDLRPREKWVAAGFAVLVLAIGLYPAAALDVIGGAAEAWVGRVAG